MTTTQPKNMGLPGKWSDVYSEVVPASLFTLPKAYDLSAAETGKPEEVIAHALGAIFEVDKDEELLKRAKAFCDGVETPPNNMLQICIRKTIINKYVYVANNGPNCFGLQQFIAHHLENNTPMNYQVRLLSHYDEFKNGNVKINHFIGGDDHRNYNLQDTVTYMKGEIEKMIDEIKNPVWDRGAVWSRLKSTPANPAERGEETRVDVNKFYAARPETCNRDLKRPFPFTDDRKYKVERLV